MLQNDLVHGTVHCYMRLGAIVGASTSEEATFATCGGLHPGALQSGRLLIQVATVCILSVL